MAEEALVQGLRMLACMGQPGRDGGLSKAEDPFSGRRVQSFGECSEHHGDLMRGSFQTVQGSVASSAERYAASLAAKGLDPFDRPMHAIANQRMNVSVGDPEVLALLIETGEAFGGYPLGGSPTAFRLTPGAYVRSRWPCTRRGRGAETTGGAIVWAAGLEQTLQRGALGPSS